MKRKKKETTIRVYRDNNVIAAFCCELDAKKVIDIIETVKSVFDKYFLKRSIL